MHISPSQWHKILSLFSDGIRNTQWYGGSCMHTDFNMGGQWFLVDQEQKYQIDKVQITNRGDYCGMKMLDPVVFCIKHRNLPL